MSIFKITIALLLLQVGGAVALFGTFWLLQRFAPELANSRFVVIPLGILVVMAVIAAWGSAVVHLAKQKPPET